MTAQSLKPDPSVLHICWNLIRGGTEGQCARTAMGLRSRGWESRVAVFRREGFFLDQVDEHCGEVFEIGIQKFIRLETWRRIQRLSSWMKKEQFSLVHTWDADAAIFGTLAARRAGIPFITSRRDLGAIYPFHKDLLLRRADRHARAVVVNAGRIKAFVRSEGVPDERIRHIPNILDLDDFDREAAVSNDWKKRLPAGPKVVMVSRLDPEKDTASVLTAFARSADSCRDAHLVLAGDGVERMRLEQLAEQVGIRGRVVFLGEVEDVPSLLAECDVGILLPKGNEGLSNTILEYLAAGLPVIATDCGGNTELVKQDVNGFIAGVGDAEGAAACLQRLLRDAALRESMGRAGRKRVTEGFAPAQVLPKFEELYRSVCPSA